MTQQFHVKVLTQEQQRHVHTKTYPQRFTEVLFIDPSPRPPENNSNVFHLVDG